MDGSCLEELDDHLEALVNADKVTTQRDCCRKVLGWLDDEQKKSELDLGTGNTRITERPHLCNIFLPPNRCQSLP